MSSSVRIVVNIGDASEVEINESSLFENLDSDPAVLALHLLAKAVRRTMGAMGLEVGKAAAMLTELARALEE